MLFLMHYLHSAMNRLHFWLLLLLPALLACEDNAESFVIPETSFTEESYGCLSLTVYKINSANDATLAVIGDRERLNLSSSESVFDLEEMDESALKVMITQLNKEAISYHCADFILEDQIVVDEWTGLSGTVKMTIIEDELATNPDGNPEYSVSVQLETLTLENANGDKIYLDEVIFSEVYVGWLPG